MEKRAKKAAEMAADQQEKKEKVAGDLEKKTKKAAEDQEERDKAEKAGQRLASLVCLFYYLRCTQD